MTMAKSTLSLWILFGLAACGTPPKPPEMAGAQPAGLGISIRIVRMPPSPLPDAAYFAKVGDRADVLSSDRVVQSNYASGNNLYLLNAEPGLYAAVAASYTDQLSAYSSFTRVLYFPEDLIKKTIVEVKPGGVAYMGTYEVKIPMLAGFGSADRAQSHYRSQMETGSAQPLPATERSSARTPASEEEFFRKAKEDLAGSDWSTKIK